MPDKHVHFYDYHVMSHLKNVPKLNPRGGRGHDRPKENPRLVRLNCQALGLTET